MVTLVSKDDITAGDGAKHDVIPEKGRLANRTTCNVFRLLKACGLPVAFEQQDSDTSFVAPKCSMLPYEVVIRREAHGSYLKRHPHLSKGQLFPQLIVELFLKTKDKSWKGKPLICDDPLLRYVKETAQVQLFDPAKPIEGQEPFLVLAEAEVFERAEEWKIFPEMRRIARQAFLVLGRRGSSRPAPSSIARSSLVSMERALAAGGRHRQRFLARGRERLLYRQAGLP